MNSSITWHLAPFATQQFRNSFWGFADTTSDLLNLFAVGDRCQDCKDAARGGRSRFNSFEGS